MGDQGEIKIRVLPRKTEPRHAEAGRTGKRKVTAGLAWPRLDRKRLSFVLVVILLAVAAVLILRTPAKSHEMASQQIVRDPTAVKISKMVDEVKAKEDFLHRQRQLENLRSKDTLGDLDLIGVAPEAPRSYGVSLDSENTADRLYGELNERPVQTAENTPDARINAMLEKNKWLNQHEREERVQYVRNFIKSAYDRGYEVELDQNLQVVGVRPITTKRISLEQALEKASRQGF